MFLRIFVEDVTSYIFKEFKVLLRADCTCDLNKDEVDNSNLGLFDVVIKYLLPNKLTKQYNY